MPVSSDTLVVYPAGATSSRGTVLATVALEAGLGVVLDRTAFHAVDTGWPDQPADRGTLAGRDISVRKGAEEWSFVVVHELPSHAAVSPGDEVEGDRRIWVCELPGGPRHPVPRHAPHRSRRAVRSDGGVRVRRRRGRRAITMRTTAS
jgi:hypothetical protein